MVYDVFMMYLLNNYKRREDRDCECILTKLCFLCVHVVI